MTLYDIRLEQENTEESEGLMMPPSRTPNVKLTVRVTPWVPMIVPPGSTLVINKETGPEAHLTGPNLGLVALGDEFYTQSRIVDGYVLVQLQGDAAEYLARAGEDLLTDAIRAIARLKVEQL